MEWKERGFCIPFPSLPNPRVLDVSLRADRWYSTGTIIIIMLGGAFLPFFYFIFIFFAGAVRGEKYLHERGGWVGLAIYIHLLVTRWVP